MRMQKRFMLTLICAIAVLTNGAIAITHAAQEKEKKEQEVVIFSATAQDGQEPGVTVISPSRSDTVAYLATEMSFAGKVVKGAPYSAESVNETIQVLADGNRIVRRSSALIYRDSEGRTRREQSLSAIGPFPVSGQQRQIISINDPVSGENYILEPDKKVARKFMTKIAMASGGGAGTGVGGGTGGKVIAQGTPRIAARAPEVFSVPSAQAGGAVIVRPQIDRMSPKEAKIEKLGKQVIEGVEVEGTRSTVTIDAGEIGNELPINIVSESWYSNELQTIVMSRHSDPRMGETIYRLTNINRAEPARSLFEVPSDYTVDESVPGEMRFKMEREIQRARKPNQSF